MEDENENSNDFPMTIKIEPPDIRDVDADSDSSKQTNLVIYNFLKLQYSTYKSKRFKLRILSLCFQFN